MGGGHWAGDTAIMLIFGRAEMEVLGRSSNREAPGEAGCPLFLPLWNETTRISKGELSDPIFITIWHA